MTILFVLTGLALVSSIALLVKFRTSLKPNKDALGVAVSIIGGLLTFAGLLFTGIQIGAGARQLEASSIYTMQKDARELFEKASGDEAYRKYVLEPPAPNKSVTDDEKRQAQRKIGLIVQFFSSIYNQYKYDVLSSDGWAVARRDMCGYLSAPVVADFWKAQLAPRYQRNFPEFNREVESCTGSP